MPGSQDFVSFFDPGAGVFYTEKKSLGGGGEDFDRKKISGQGVSLGRMATGQSDTCISGRRTYTAFTPKSKAVLEVV